MKDNAVIHNKDTSVKRISKKISNIAFIIFILLIGILAFISIQSKALGKIPTLGVYQLYSVVSGSMEPEIHTGSILFVSPANPEQLSVNDIITFKSMDNIGKLVTHRIVEVNVKDDLSFTTKGDANNVEDQVAVTSENIVGKVSFEVPYLGYLINFAQSKNGILFLIIIPGILLLIFEIRKLIKYAILIDREKEKKKSVEAGNKTLEE